MRSLTSMYSSRMRTDRQLTVSLHADPPPPKADLWTESQTSVKALPSPILRMRSLTNYLTFHCKFRFTWINKQGIIVQVISLGGAVTSIQVPDKNGKVEDVVAGYDTMEGEQNKRIKGPFTPNVSVNTTTLT